MIDKDRFQQLAEQYVNGELDDTAAEELCRAVTESRELCELLRVQAAMHAVLERRGTLGNRTVGRRVQAALRDPTQKKGAITRIMEKLPPKPQKKTPQPGTRSPIANLNPPRSAEPGRAGVAPATCDAGGSPASGAGRPPAPQIRRRSNAFLFYSAATAALLCIAVLVYLKTRPTPSSLPTDPDDIAWALPDTIEAVARAKPTGGEAHIQRGSKTLALKKERPLIAGDIVATTERDTLALEYPDKTSVEVAAGTKLTLQPKSLPASQSTTVTPPPNIPGVINVPPSASAPSLPALAANVDYGICLILDQGSIEAAVSPQPAGKPMIVATPQGRAIIVGTRFTLVTNPTTTRLDVAEGKVRLESGLKNESVLVGAGHSATVVPGIPLDVVPTTRDPALWPFSPKSPWNYPLGSGAQFAAIDSPRFNPANGVELVYDSFSIPIYAAGPDDPQRLLFRNPTREGAKPLQVPRNAKPEPSYLSLMNVIDAEHLRVYEMTGVKLHDDGAIQVATCSFNSVQHMGVYSDNKQHGSRIYGGSSMGGIIRKGELPDPRALDEPRPQGSGIRHALGVSVHQSALNSNAPGGRPYVWPASNALSNWETAYGKTGNLHLGSLLAIPPDVDLSTLNLRGPAFEIAHALQDYGAYIIEHYESGSQDIKFFIEPTESPDILKDLDTQLVPVLKLLKVVTNNSPDLPGGGGRPRRTFAPPFEKHFNANADVSEKQF